jgi:hypothetical protein
MGGPLLGGFGVRSELKIKPIPKAFKELGLRLRISYSIKAAIIGITTAANPSYGQQDIVI